MFQYTGTTTMYSKDFVSATSFEDILYKNNQCEIYKSATQTKDYPDKCVFLRNINTLTGISVAKKTIRDVGEVLYTAGRHPALIVVDSNPIGLSYESIA